MIHNYVTYVLRCIYLFICSLKKPDLLTIMYDTLHSYQKNTCAKKSIEEGRGPLKGDIIIIRGYFTGKKKNIDF